MNRIKLSGINTREEYSLRFSELVEGVIQTTVFACMDCLDKEEVETQAEKDGLYVSHGICDKHFNERFNDLI